MDKIIEDKRLIKPRHWKFIIPGLIICVSLSFVFLSNSVSTVKVEKDKIMIDTVFKGQFNNYMKITGQAAPISTIYLDAIESGRVEEILIEEGAMVKKDDVILRLSNNNLNLSILNSEAQLAEKGNFLRETRLTMEQQKLNLELELIKLEYDLRKKRRFYEQNKVFYEKQVISKEDFIKAQEDFELTEKLLNMTRIRYKQDSVFRKLQIEQLQQSLKNMQLNLSLVNQRLDNLNVKAPIDGQLGTLNAELGQSISEGLRIGQINVLTSFKIEAEIDEHYIDKVKKGLVAAIEKDNDTLRLKIKKVYPDVREGRFMVDLVFTDSLSQNIRTGQTYHISLQLGYPEEALQIQRGGFFQSTGGQWVYVLSPDETHAVRRNIKLGRQNPKVYEVIEGLMPGEKVITSNYDIFGENEKVIFK